LALAQEECGPDIRWGKGPENTVADALSRLPTANDPEKPHGMPSREELADCFAENPLENWSFPISVTLIKSCQQLDLDSVRKAASNDPAHAVSPFRGGAVICHNGKVATPLQLRTHMVKWCCEMSCHPGTRGAEETMR
jgi:hypothetical protein